MQIKQIARLLAVAAGALISSGLWAADTTKAKANGIESLQVRVDGDSLLVRVDLAEELAALPANWTVIEPPRIVLDFPGTANKTGKNMIPVANADLKSMNIVQTDDLTRLVLNLYRPAQYKAELQGKVLYLRLQKQSIASAGAPASTNAEMKQAFGGSVALAQALPSIREIDFRRGDTGEAVISIDLTDGNVPVDIKRDGDTLKVEIARVELPERLQAKRDVNDFATPVNSVSSLSIGGTAKIDVLSRGAWFHQSRLTGNQLVVEVRPIPQSDANKLVQTGQQGQKVSINFFDADATMILRTLAEISGKNVMIDPSLSGRKVTVGLDNIAYDQALDIVMAQVNVGMRIRNDVILFGDRTVLQKRDQDVADELARANETAQLVSETFTLSYIKPSDLSTLIQVNVAQAGGAQNLQQTTVAPNAAPSAPKPTGGGGMLSPRGTMATHDLTKKLFVRDTQAVIEAIREIVRNVDVPQKQVMIEARIVEASTGFTNTLGARLKLFTADSLSKGGSTFGNSQLKYALGTTDGLTNTDSFGSAATPTLARSTQVFAPSYNLKAAANFGLMLFNKSATQLLALELQAAETDLKNKTVSAPKVVTMDRKAATINNTQQVTILTGVNATTGLPIYQTFSAPLNLTVTPSINPDNRISLELNIAKSTITNANTGSLDTNTVTTAVIVENGGTVAIGGFTREGENVSQDRMPFLGDLPYVGFLFKSTQTVKSRSELLVFITPRIVGDGAI